MLSGFLSALLIILFCGIVGWAYSSRRQSEFDALSRMPLAADREETRP